MNLDEKTLDKIKELINIGIGKSGSVLNHIVKNRVSLSVPKVSLISMEEFKNHNFGYEDNKLSAVSLKFEGEVEGKAEIVFPVDSAIQIVDILTAKSNHAMEMDTLRKNALSEVGNIVLNSLIGTFANMLNIRFQYKIPTYKEMTDKAFHLDHSEYEVNVIMAETNFKVQKNEIEGSFLLFFEIDSFDNFLNKLEKFNA